MTPPNKNVLHIIATRLPYAGKIFSKKIFQGHARNEEFAKGGG